MIRRKRRKPGTRKRKPIVSKRRIRIRNTGAASHRIRNAGVATQGYRDGRSWRSAHAGRESADSAAHAAHLAWSRLAAHRKGSGRRWPILLRDGRRYLSGFWRGAGVRGRLFPVPLRGSAAAVVYAAHGADSTQSLLKTLRQLPLEEIVVVLPGDSSPLLLASSQSQHGVTTVYRPDLADPDIGRALGGKLARADSVLFVDGSNRATSARLARFLWKCDNGMDVALNDTSGQLGSFHRRSHVYQLAEFLNRTLNRRDLRASSLSVLPYALSRRALQAIGPGPLAVPPHAHTAAILGGLRVGIAGTASAAGPARPERIADGYAQAWRAAQKRRGNRQSFPDMVRNRTIMEEWP